MRSDASSSRSAIRRRACDAKGQGKWSLNWRTGGTETRRKCNLQAAGPPRGGQPKELYGLQDIRGKLPPVFTFRYDTSSGRDLKCLGIRAAGKPGRKKIIRERPTGSGASSGPPKSWASTLSKSLGSRLFLHHVQWLSAPPVRPPRQHAKRYVDAAPPLNRSRSGLANQRANCRHLHRAAATKSSRRQPSGNKNGHGGPTHRNA